MRITPHSGWSEVRNADHSEVLQGLVFECPILAVLGCYRNGHKCREYIVVEVVDSPCIIGRAFGHEVSNGTDMKRAFLGRCFKLAYV